MRPHLIYFALTSTALIVSGCSSARSISNPFRGSTGVASSANDFNEYDRDPPAPRQSSRVAVEPSPVPPARGISLSRIIDATPAGFRRAIGCGDSCTGDTQAAAPCGSDGCGADACSSEGCGTQPVVRNHRRRLCDFRLFKFKPISCFKKPCVSGDCTDETSCTGAADCTDQGCNTCAAPSNYRQPQSASTGSQDCYSEDRPRIAPPLGERQQEYDDRPEAFDTPTQNEDSPSAVPDAPGMVPDVPVDPIGQTRSLQPSAWKPQPLYGTVDAMGEVQKPVIHLEPPVWQPYHPSNPEVSGFQNPLFPTAARLRTPSFMNDSNGASDISIQPLMRVQEPVTADSL